MNATRKLVIIVLLWGLLSEASAQPVLSHRTQSYIDLGMGLAQLEAPREGFPMRPVVEPSVTLGYVWDHGQSIELRGSYLHFKTTGGSTDSGPVHERVTTVSLRGLPLEASYQFEPPRLHVGKVRPLLGLGATWIPIWSFWESDVPAKGKYVSGFGGLAYLGSTIGVNDRVSVRTRAGYRYTRRSDAYLVRGARYVQGLRVRGFFFDVGLRFFF